MTKEIDFYFDFISPYSYLAHHKIKTIKNVNFNYKPVLVGGLHNLQGITAPAFIKAKLKHMISDCDLIAKKENKPIPVIYNGKTLSTMYYGDSELLNKLKYYPFALLLILLLFSAVILLYYKSTQVASQNKLWTGMAKETAHQIGTPLSSLVGWAELLKSEAVNPDYISEIEKDIQRLETITDRFSKIGSMPVLRKSDIVKATIESFNYLKSRSSKLISFEITSPETEIIVPLNLELFSWTIENLVINGIDSMKGKGLITLSLTTTEKIVLINVTDSGKGIKNNLFKKVFETGFTSKKRGWGLGLSLAKRIIEDYHNGKIKVLKSEIDVGTTIQISLKRL